MKYLDLSVLDNRLSIYRFKNGVILPSWIYASEFYSITKTTDEASVVADKNDEDLKDLKVSLGWRVIKVIGPLDFSLVGIIANISTILKQANISIFTISTYDTDYILVKEDNLQKAIQSLEENGHHFTNKTKPKP